MPEVLGGARMKVNLVLQRTLWDPEMTWKDTKIIEVEIPMEKMNPDGKGDFHVIGCFCPDNDAP